MPTEQLILRRVFPVPVTDADNHRADEIMAAAGEHPMDATAWHAAIKEVTGALDEAYAVIDGREVRVAIVRSPTDVCVEALNQRERAAVESLLIAADEAGYWQRPHEVRVDLEERPVSHDIVARAVMVGQQYAERKAVRS